MNLISGNFNVWHWEKPHDYNSCKRPLLQSLFFSITFFFLQITIVIFILIITPVTSSKQQAIKEALNGLNGVLSCHSPFEPRDAVKHGNLHYLKFLSGSG